MKPNDYNKLLTASRILLAVFFVGIYIATHWSRERSSLLNNLGSVKLNQAFEFNAEESKSNAIFTRAGLYFQQAVSLNSNNGQVYYNLGTIYAQFKDINSAHAAFSKSVELMPGDVLSLFKLGIIKASMGDEANAISLWKQAHAADFFVNTSYMFLREGNFDSALRDVKRVIDIDPQHVPAYYALAEIYAEKQDFIGALQAYQTALIQTPDNVISLYGAGLMYERLEQVDKATVYYQRAIEQHPQYFPALRSLANIYANQGQCNLTEVVLAELMTSKTKKSHSASALRIVSTCYFKKQEFDRALPYLEELVGFDKVTSQDYINLALVYEALSWQDNAIEVYKYVLGIDPDNKDAQDALIRLVGGE
jgi:tetratricopeptide (TPR) repeat protein